MLVDANLLVYANVATMPGHPRAKDWFEGALNGHARLGLPWQSLVAFVRLTSNPRVFEYPQSVADAWSEVTRWLQCPAVWVPVPTDRHAAVLGSLIPHTAGRANLVPDAHLAALAIEHGLTVCSADGDFARFTGVKWFNPLA